MADYVVKCPNLTIFVGICPYSLMDRISDSGSDGCGSIPHGGTKKEMQPASPFSLSVRDENSYDTEYIYDVLVREFEVRKFVLILRDERECACFRTVVYDLP